MQAARSSTARTTDDARLTSTSRRRNSGAPSPTCTRRAIRAARDLLERLFEWFRCQLAEKPLTAHDWHKLVLMLQTIRPYDGDGDVRHGLAFRTDDGEEHVGHIKDGAARRRARAMLH